MTQITQCQQAMFLTLSDLQQQIKNIAHKIDHTRQQVSEERKKRSNQNSEFQRKNKENLEILTIKLENAKLTNKVQLLQEELEKA